MSDLIIALIGVAAGWGLSQGTELVKSHCQNKKLKNLLTQELRDIEPIVADRVETLKRNQSYEKSRMAYFGAPISTPFLDKHYIDIASELSDAQRFNLRCLKDHLRSLNLGLEWIEKSVNSPSELSTKHIQQELTRIYRQSLLAKITLEEANKSGGQVAIKDGHPALTKVQEEISEFTS